MNATDMRRFYVALSRARHNAVIYTDDKQALQQAVERDDPRRTATELIEQDRRYRAREVGTRQVVADTAKRWTQSITRRISRRRERIKEHYMEKEMTYGR